MYKPVLTAPEREVLLGLLSEQAPDDVLLDAVNQVMSNRKSIRQDITTIAKDLGKNPIEMRQGLRHSPAAHTQAIPPQNIPDIKAPEAPSVPPAIAEPPGPAAGRITTASKNTVINRLKTRPATVNELNQAVNGVLGNTARILRLLWERDVIKYDGTKFYL